MPSRQLPLQYSAIKNEMPRVLNATGSVSRFPFISAPLSSKIKAAGTASAGQSSTTEPSAEEQATTHPSTSCHYSQLHARQSTTSPTLEGRCHPSAGRCRRLGLLIHRGSNRGERAGDSIPRHHVPHRCDRCTSLRIVECPAAKTRRAPIH